MLSKHTLYNISSNLKYLRNKNNYTQIEISHYLEMERKGYQKIEYGQIKDVKLSTILKILNFYNISLEKLISKNID